MSLDRIVSQTGEWLKGTGSEADIVISSRVRLARNVEGYPFMSRASEEVRDELEALLREGVMAAKLAKEMLYVNVRECTPVDRTFLSERRLISREHAEGSGNRGVAFSKTEMISLMINEEDHLRMQAMRSGFQLVDTWKAVKRIDNALEKKVSFAFSPQLGYLTACPTNVGTGMRASAMLHLPALVLSKQIEKVFHAVSKINLAVRGVYGEGTQASGDFYQISNQITLGKSAEEIVGTLESVVPQIIRYEREAREALLGKSRVQLEDRCWRALGMLKTARSLSSEEAMHLLSSVRMGVNLGLIDEIKIKAVNDMWILTQPAHLQKMEGRDIDQEARDVARATFMRKRFGHK